MLKLYHAEPVANSLKTLISMKEKGLEFQSVYVNLHKFEQHEPWFIAINPEGQVPALEHDGNIVTHTTVIGEYLEDAFPDAPPLRPADPLGKARMRYWNKFVDEQVMEYVSMHGWHRMVGVIARSIANGEFEKLMERIPLPRQREKWTKARAGFSEADLANATRKIEQAVEKVEAQLARARGRPAPCTPSPTSTSSPSAEWPCPAVPGDGGAAPCTAAHRLGRPRWGETRREGRLRDAESHGPEVAHLHRRSALTLMEPFA